MKYYIITFIDKGIKLNLQTKENLDKVKISAINEETFKKIDKYANENNIDILSIEPDYFLYNKVNLINELKEKEKNK